MASTDNRIHVAHPVVEMNGDEMAGAVWKLVKGNLITPFVDVPIQYFDLSIQNRNDTNDEVTNEAVRAVRAHNVGIKCPTITPDEHSASEFGLTNPWRRPNGPREILGGTIFREPIVCKNIPRLIPGWIKPITIGRHSYADQYKASEIVIPGPGKVELVYTGNDGTSQVVQINKFTSPGIALGMFNTDASICAFARACMNIALYKRQSLYFTTKNTILKTYDGRFKNIFEQIYSTEFAAQFAKAGINYEHRLIDDMVAFMLKSDGGYIWACKNYDGDIEADCVGQGFNSPGLMTTVLISPDGRTIQTEPGHGTVTRHFRMWKRQSSGEITATNPVASIFAWTRGLAHRGKLDDNAALVEFCTAVERNCVELIEGGVMTRDLALLVKGEALSRSDWVTCDAFIDILAGRLHTSLGF
ncbi:isocitrate dehydrogenase [Pelomyxa schiedti]|nr:isocitrate dehydrogenase [Pelomyxa schiedti]